MLSPHRMRRYLNHNSQRVREFAAGYFSESYSQDKRVMQLLLQSCDYYGAEENALLLRHAAELKQTAESLQGVLQRLAQAIDGNTIDQYNSIVRGTAPHLLRKFSREILNAKNLSTLTQENVESKIDALGRSTEELWEEILSYEGRYSRDLSREQLDRGQHAVEVLAGRDDLPSADIAKRLRNHDSDGNYGQILVVELVGRGQMRQALPLLLDRLGSDSDWLCDTVADTLVRMGDDQLMEILTGEFLQSDWDFRMYAASVFGRVKVPASEEALLQLLPGEGDSSVRALLAKSLGYLVSEDGIPLMNELIREGSYDRGMVELPRLLDTVCTLLDHKLPT